MKIICWGNHNELKGNEIAIEMRTSIIEIVARIVNIRNNHETITTQCRC